jgi:hypothetical protein
MVHDHHAQLLHGGRTDAFEGSGDHPRGFEAENGDDHPRWFCCGMDP